MVHRHPHTLTATPARLDALLFEAFDCASKLRQVDVADAILCAVELHAKKTGKHATRDAAYAAIARSAGIGRLRGDAGNR
mgnify:CR=1 FL=1